MSTIHDSLTRRGVSTALAALVLSATGCGGGGSAGDSVFDGGANSTFSAASQTLYTVQPDTTLCRTGTLSVAEQSAALAAVNAIRAAHGLAAVVHDAAGDAEVMQISLMSVVNRALNHVPPSTWGCYSAVGLQGAGSSNLYLGGPSAFLALASSAAILNGWLADVGSEATLGHRRWLLDPFLKQVAFGRVDVEAASGVRTTAAALKVIYAADDTGTVTPDYVAYPVGDYKKAYFQGDPILSFTAIADKSSRSANGSARVDFSAATVSVVPRGGAALAVSALSPDYAGYGVPNVLRFRATGITAGVVHDVAVANVRVNGVLRTYSYTFRLVD